MFAYCFKLICGAKIRNYHPFSKFYCFQSFLEFLHSLKKLLFATHVKAKFKLHKYNYVLANILHHFSKSVGYRKLENIRKSMQIRKQLVQKFFWVK